jgi:hypothetical protein
LNSKNGSWPDSWAPIAQPACEFSRKNVSPDKLFLLNKIGLQWQTESMGQESDLLVIILARAERSPKKIKFRSRSKRGIFPD